MKFILNVPSIEGTIIESYINLNEKEQPPVIYKPRKGKINANIEKFSEKMLEGMCITGGKMLKNFGYYHMFNENYKQEPGIPSWIQKWNNATLQKTITIHTKRLENLEISRQKLLAGIPIKMAEPLK